MEEVSQLPIASLKMRTWPSQSPRNLGTTPDHAIFAKNPFDELRADATPVCWHKDHVDVEWRPPANERGAPIDGYIFKKTKFEDWVECANGKKTIATAYHLASEETTCPCCSQD
ncbi:unnamed protein product [Caenorhabditis brenneri]